MELASSLDETTRIIRSISDSSIVRSDSLCSLTNVNTDSELTVEAAEDYSALDDNIFETTTPPEQQFLLSPGRPPRLPELITFSPSALKYVGKTASACADFNKYTAIGDKYQMRFKMIKCNQRLVRTILHSYGFEQCSQKNPNFNLLWTSSHLKPHILRALTPWQRINHFPRSFELTRKDKLYENIARARQKFGDAFDFIPNFYITPQDISLFSAACATSNCTKPFIVKPIASSRGAGIFIVQKPNEIPLKSKMLVSEYIDNPLLISGHKFDLRIYVLVTSFHPLTAYVYNDGLTRFASEKYSNSSSTYDQQLSHLTNYSLNKLSDSFIRNERADAEDSGHKWTIGGLLRKIEADGVDARLLMVRIEDLIIKALLSVQGAISAACRSNLVYSRCCFELFGFDVLIDDKLKPWLLEVNLSPSLTCDSPLDLYLKSRLICDCLTLAAIPLVSRRNAEATGQHTAKKIPVSRDIILRHALKLKRGAVLSGRDLSSYNAQKRTRSYEHKAKCHLQRFKTESNRKGGFVCIFPRENSWQLYSELMDDVGAEKWDQRLHEDLYGMSSMNLANCQLAKQAHRELMDCTKFTTASHLSQNVQQLLSSSLRDVESYMKRLTNPGKKYAVKLPRIRNSARKRTKSFEDTEELKKGNCAEKQMDDSLPPTSDLALYRAKICSEESKKGNLPIADEALLCGFQEATPA